MRPTLGSDKAAVFVPRISVVTKKEQRTRTKDFTTQELSASGSSERGWRWDGIKYCQPNEAPRTHPGYPAWGKSSLRLF